MFRLVPPSLVPRRETHFTAVGRWQVEKDCVPVAYSISDQLGQGVYSSVYRLCRFDSCDFVVKIQLIQSSQAGLPMDAPARQAAEPILTFEAFKREVLITHEMGEHGVSPRVEDAWICNIYNPSNNQPVADAWAGFIVMEALQGNIRNLPDALKDIDYLRPQIIPLIDTMHRFNVAHGDLHIENVMYKTLSSGQYRFYLIDYGLARTPQDPDYQQRLKQDDNWIRNNIGLTLAQALWLMKQD